jgi:hypothetical protein
MTCQVGQLLELGEKVGGIQLPNCACVDHRNGEESTDEYAKIVGCIQAALVA